MKKASPGLSPTAAETIHKAQPGRFSIAHVPPSCWQGYRVFRLVNKLLTEAVLTHRASPGSPLADPPNDVADEKQNDRAKRSSQDKEE